MIITPIQVRFNDIDPMRRVNNSSYAGYLELVRMDFCKKYFTVKEINDTTFVLVRLKMDIVYSLIRNEYAEVQTIVSRIGNTSWDFTSKIVNPDNETIYVHAKATQILFDYNKTTVKISGMVKDVLKEKA